GRSSPQIRRARAFSLTPSPPDSTTPHRCGSTLISPSSPPVPISARTPTSPASRVNTGLCKGRAEPARTAKGPRGRGPGGEARVSFDAAERVVLYDLYRTIRTTEGRGSGASGNVVSLRASNAWAAVRQA